MVTDFKPKHIHTYPGCLITNKTYTSITFPCVMLQPRPRSASHAKYTFHTQLFVFGSRERPSRPVSESDPEVAERLAMGSTETLTNGNKADLQAAKRLAKRLYNLDGFKKSDVARHLSKK